MLIFRYTEVMVSHQPWYSQGYRANIVTYTIALLHKMITTQFSGKDLDLMSIWNKQTVPESLSEALTGLSELVYYNLTEPNGVVENVTQWCKREACWKKVQEIEFDLPAGLESYLIGQEERKTAEREAKADQRVISGAEIQAKVCCEITEEQWKKALDFALPKRMLSPDEHTALRIACQIPAKMPTPTQCKKLLAVLERIQSEGFKL